MKDFPSNPGPQGFKSLWQGPRLSVGHQAVPTPEWLAVGLYGIDAAGTVWAYCEDSDHRRRWFRLADIDRTD